jgi:hypothetical protein
MLVAALYGLVVGLSYGLGDGLDIGSAGVVMPG